MIQRIMPESYLPKNYQPGTDQRWYPTIGTKVQYKNQACLIVDVDTDMGGRQIVAIVRYVKIRSRWFPWAHLRFVEEVDFHKLMLLPGLKSDPMTGDDILSFLAYKQRTEQEREIPI